MKKRAILIPTLLIGLGVGGLTVSQAFAQSNTNTTSTLTPASSTAPTSTSTAPWGDNGFANMMGAGFAPGGGSVGSGNPSQSAWSGMMGQAFGGTGGSQGNWTSTMGSMMSHFFGQVKTVNPSDANQEMQSSLKNATIDKINNTITYSGQTVKIVAFGGAMDNSSSGPDEKFMMGGLVNPTLHVQKGAHVTLELVNEDTGMPHGIEVTSAQPPYGVMSMMQGGIYPGAFIHPIPAASKDAYPVATTSFTASQAGTFHYICEYPGHAAKGMYGKIIVG